MTVTELKNWLKDKEDCREIYLRTGYENISKPLRFTDLALSAPTQTGGTGEEYQAGFDLFGDKKT